MPDFSFLVFLSVLLGASFGYWNDMKHRGTGQATVALRSSKHGGWHLKDWAEWQGGTRLGRFVLRRRLVTDMMSWCRSVCHLWLRRSYCYCNFFDGFCFCMYIYIHTLRFFAVERTVAHCQDPTTPCPSWTFWNSATLRQQKRSMVEIWRSHFARIPIFHGNP